MAHERGTRSIIVSPGPYPAINSPPDCWIILFSSHLSHQKKRMTFGVRERDSFNHGIAGALPGDQQSTGLLDCIILVPSLTPKKEDAFWRTREGLVQSRYRRGPTRRSTVHWTVGLYYSRPISRTKKEDAKRHPLFWCERWDSNPHGETTRTSNVLVYHSNTLASRLNIITAPIPFVNPIFP